VLPQAEAKGSKQNDSFPWPPLQAALCMSNVSIFVKKQSFEMQSIKTKDAVISAE
jgi:hypothetical protein